MLSNQDIANKTARYILQLKELEACKKLQNLTDGNKRVVQALENHCIKLGKELTELGIDINQLT